jgi:hypothetical protein
MAVPHGRSSWSLEGNPMHWILICLGALPLLAYVLPRLGGRPHAASSTATSASAPERTNRISRWAEALLVVLALPFLLRAALVVLTILGLIYVFLFGPIKPIHEWLH